MSDDPKPQPDAPQSDSKPLADRMTFPAGMGE